MRGSEHGVVNNERPRAATDTRVQRGVRIDFADQLSIVVFSSGASVSPRTASQQRAATGSDGDVDAQEDPAAGVMKRAIQAGIRRN